jgi:Rps23 Pro-64 3,4-dihydroxylase Tpa1-like proline 4-hydroxylase
MENAENLNSRIQDYYRIDQETWSSIEDLGHGILVYHDVLPKEMNIVERLENVLEDSSNFYKYEEAMVGYGMKMPEYRDCYDFKYKKTDIMYDPSEASKSLQALWQDLYDRKVVAVKDYAKRFNIGELRYWEAMNFVKYGPGQHFQEHSDHGYSYNCVVSLVAYPTDNYLGGELEFRLQKLKIKPRAGDLFIFPSNYMYPHKSLPVKSGIKHSIVTMLDYSDKYHNQKFYSESGS